LTCQAGFADCNGVAADGCEVDLNASASHCGACGQACALPRATSTCFLGECRIASCDANWGHCIGPAAGGCETDLRVTDAHCGRCGTICDAGARCIFGGCVALSDYDRAVLADRPTLYLPLDETSGSTVRDLVGGLTGTIRGAVVPSAAPLTAGGSAMTFSGGFIEVPMGPASGASGYTLEFWARRAVLDGTPLSAAVSMRNGPSCMMTQGFTAYVEPGALGRWQIYSGTRAPPSGQCWDVVAGGPPAADTRHHVVAAYDGTTLRLYVDGIRGAELMTAWVPYAGALLVGAMQNIPGGAVSLPFAGVLDNVAFYDRALNGTAVANHFAAR
jgi:hypothetical protein